LAIQLTSESRAMVMFAILGTLAQAEKSRVVMSMEIQAVDQQKNPWDKRIELENVFSSVAVCEGQRYSAGVTTDSAKRAMELLLEERYGVCVQCGAPTISAEDLLKEIKEPGGARIAVLRADVCVDCSSKGKKPTIKIINAPIHTYATRFL